MRGHVERWVRRLRPLEASDVLFAAVVLAFTFSAARVWWLSTIVPGMDYPQFLLFVRALQDCTNPSSPFHGTYTVGPWFVPTSLPVNLTSLLSHFCGPSIEVAGKLLLTMQNVGLVAATLYLLRVLGRNRWAILLLFPVIHCHWTVVGGFFAYATSLPLVLLAWAFTVRWLFRLELRWGIALGACLCATVLWHGIGFGQAGLGFATLWALWRAPSWRARVLGGLPTLPCLAQCAVWMGSTFTHKTVHKPPDWMSPWEASEKIFDFIWATVPHRGSLALALFFIVGVGLALSPANLGGSGPMSKIWRVRNPFLVLALVYLAGFYVFPMDLNGVESVCTRFPYVAVLAFVFAWNLPSGLAERGIVLAAVGGFAAWCLHDITARFRAFDADTRGASDLMDQVGLYETLYYSPPGQGASKDFEGLANKPMRELEQYASVRHGGLPNSSFAGYGYTYIRYNQNPMPGLFGMSYTPAMTEFDYVLTRAGSALSGEHFKLVVRAKGWELYGVCGSKKYPTCT